MNKKTAILIATLALSLMSATALGVLYITRQVQFQASILVSGDFQIFEDADCTTELTSFDFGELDNSKTLARVDKVVYLKSLGNQPIEIAWKLIDDNMTWECVNNGDYYLAPETIGSQWLLKAGYDNVIWMPTDAVDGEQPDIREYGLVLGVGQVKNANITLVAAKSEVAFVPSTIDFIIQFTAYDKYPETVKIL